MSALPKQRYTLEEYLELDARSEERLEYWDGEVYSMSGVSKEHNQIEINTIYRLRSRLEGRPCHLFAANMRIKVPSLPPYRYGDLSALCGQPQFEEVGGVDILVNPGVIVEILSSSTEAYDRGDKFSSYKAIPTLSEYLLIAQHRPHVAQFLKQPDASWLNLEFNALSDAFRVASLQCELTLDEIYSGIAFP